MSLSLCSSLINEHLAADQYLKAHRDLLAGELSLREWRVRPHATSIAREQVIGDFDTFTRFLLVAYEAEYPWDDYSVESRGYFTTGLLPHLGSFMIRVWRQDERRHGPVLGALYTRLTGGNLNSAHPHAVEAYVEGERGLQGHYYTRLNAELSAASFYTVLAGQCEGAARRMLLNLAGDEYRHLGLFWAEVAGKWGKVGGIVRLAKRNWRALKEHRKRRTGIGELGLKGYLLIGQVGLVEIRLALHLMRLPDISKASATNFG